MEITIKRADGQTDPNDSLLTAQGVTFNTTDQAEATEQAAAFLNLLTATIASDSYDQVILTASDFTYTVQVRYDLESGKGNRYTSSRVFAAIQAAEGYRHPHDIYA